MSFGRLGFGDIFPDVVAIVAWHLVGVALLGRPFRTLGERASLMGVAALSVMPGFVVCYAYFGRGLRFEPYLQFSLICAAATVGYWLLGLLLFVSWDLAWQRLTTIEYDRSCRSCGKDMNGNPASACPNCGALVHFDQNVESKEAKPVNVVPFDANSNS